MVAEVEITRVGSVINERQALLLTMFRYFKPILLTLPKVLRFKSPIVGYVAIFDMKCQFLKLIIKHCDVTKLRNAGLPMVRSDSDQKS